MAVVAFLAVEAMLFLLVGPLLALQMGTFTLAIGVLYWLYRDDAFILP